MNRYWMVAGISLDSQENQSQDTTRAAKSSALRAHPPNSVTSAAPTTHELVEAQGGVYGSNGEVILTASASTVTPQSPSLMPANCQSDRSEAP